MSFFLLFVSTEKFLFVNRSKGKQATGTKSVMHENRKMENKEVPLKTEKMGENKHVPKDVVWIRKKHKLNDGKEKKRNEKYPNSFLFSPLFWLLPPTHNLSHELCR